MKYNHTEYDEKLYEESMKMRNVIEKNFKIKSAFESTRMFDQFSTEATRVASVRTEEGLHIQWEGYWFTKDEKEEIDRDHIESDVADYHRGDEQMSPEECADLEPQDNDNFTTKEVR